MPRHERDVNELSVQTINNMRSELYQLEERLLLYPDDSYAGYWSERADKLRRRLGDKVVPRSRRIAYRVRADLAEGEQNKVVGAVDRAQKVLEDALQIDAERKKAPEEVTEQGALDNWVEERKENSDGA